MHITKRTLTGDTVAFAAWQLQDGTVVFVKVLQAQYDAFAIKGRGVGDPPGRPDPAATFLIGGGGVPALDTADGWPSIGDVWERVNDETGEIELHVATGDGYDWEYSFDVASDPGLSGQSMLSEFSAQSVGNRARFRPDAYAKDAGGLYAVTATRQLTLDADVLTVLEAADTEAVRSEKTIPNHKSVTFDAKSSGASLTASLTIAHVVTNTQTNLHLSVWTGFANGGGQTISDITYNGTSLGAALVTGDPALGRRAEQWAMANPSTGTNNIVITQSGAANDLTGGGWSAYGADQGTLYSNTGSANGTSTTPAVTITSAVGELVVTCTLSRNQDITPDGSWASDWNATGAAIRYAGSHLAGAASVTRTDSIASGQWILIGASIKASGPTVAQEMGGIASSGGDMVGQSW